MSRPQIFEGLFQIKHGGSSPKPAKLSDQKWFVRLVQVLLACVFAFFLHRINLDYLEAFFYDIRVQTKPITPLSGNIELILVKPSTIELLKGPPKFDLYSELLIRLKGEGAKYILFSTKLDEVEGTQNEKVKFNNLAKEIGSFFVLSNELVMKGEEETKKIELPSPLNQVPVVSAPTTWDRAILAKDGVTRRLLISAYERELFHTRIAQSFNQEILDTNNIKGQLELFDTEQVYIDFRPSHTYPEVHFEDVIKGEFEPNRFRNKIVIIGWDFDRDAKDYIRTPYNRESVKAMNLAEMHANMIDTLILNTAPKKIPNSINLFVTILISILTIYVVMSLKPSTGLIIMAASFFGYIAIAWFMFWPFGYWIHVAHPLIAIFLCYYFFIPYRLIMENRRSWEYYQKNRLLHQVEELKTNFISMMSHDLKTPLARIQGMTEVILHDHTALSTQQREALDTIRHSSDDLLGFINMILNYGKIESDGVKLHLQSKDINVLIKDVIKKHEFLAKLKHIQIVAELEPLFPIEVDPELFKQIISNLIENAIKYSPDNKKILITSEELGPKVVIQVADQGPGIPSDELPNIFMKFFRSKNAKSSPIKGSGLGLYLAKYFTELHKGALFVESTYGQGSTFTVELPIVQGSPGLNAPT